MTNDDPKEQPTPSEPSQKPTHREPVQPESTEPTTPPHRRRRRWGWWVGGGAGVVVLLLLAVVLALPTLLSTGPMQRWLTGYVNTTIAGSINIDRLRLAWFGGQSAFGVTLADAQGDLVASIRRVEASELRLAAVLLGSSRYGLINVDAEAIHLRQAAGEPTNLQLALQSTRPDPAPPADDEPMQLDRDLAVQLDFTADRVTYEAPDVERVELTDLDVGIEIPDLNRIAGRIHSNLVHGDRPGRIDVNFNLNDAFTAAGEPQMGQANVQAQGELASFPLNMADRLMGQEGRLAALLGDELDATFAATGPVRSMTVNLQASSANLSANMELVGDDEAIRAAEGSQLQLQVTPTAFAAWMAEPAPGEAPPMTLVQPFTVDVQLAELVLPRDEAAGIDLVRAALNLQATTEDIVLDMPDMDRITLGEPRVTVQSARLGDEVTANLQSQATYGEVSEAVSASLAIRQLFAEDEPMLATLEATALPMALADAVADLDGALALTIGETLSTTVNLTQTQTGDLTFDGRVDAPRLAGPFEGGYAADGLITLRTPEPMVLQLSPQAFARWAAGEDGLTLALEEDAEVTLNVEQLAVAMLTDDLQAPAEADADDEAAEPTMRLDPERTRVALQLSSPVLRLRDLATDERFGIEQGRVNVRGDDLRQLLEFDIEAMIYELTEELGRPQQEPQPQQQNNENANEAAAGDGRISSRTRVGRLLSDDGEVQPSASRIESNTTLTRVPSSVLDALGGQGGSLAAVLGARTSADARVDYDGAAGGTLDIDLESDNATANVPGRLTPELALELREDAVASLRVTPEMSQALLSTINPFLQAISGERPAELVLREEGFHMPLEDFDMERVRMNASLGLGELRLQQGGVAQALFGALSAVGGRFDPGQEYSARFSPMTFGLDQGAMSYDDLRMTVSGVTVGFRGRVHYDTQQFNLVTSVPAASLGRIASGLERAVGPNYQLEVPLTGTFDEPRLDSGAMTRELAQLAMRAGLREAVGDRDNGLGGLLDGVLGGRRQRDNNEQPPAEREEPTEEAEEEAEEERREPARDLLDVFRRR
ncbi:hypothetical protein ACERK3_03680 [Phycisphaerales bacterium AB-hyl4]|uniref:AsmA-like protein n=1 Tax=Natronomicrosphaera hydrolytica TaxID=3242702 RepID=A0ABV4U1C0_9BACT